MSDPGLSLDALMAAAQRGDEAAYRTLLQALAVALRRFFRRWLGEAAAEDLVQETLVALHQRRRTYDPRRPFADWLFAIARYKLLNHLKAEGRPVPAPREAWEAGADGDLAASTTLDLDRRMAALRPPGAALVDAGTAEGHAAPGVFVDRVRSPLLQLSALRMLLQRAVKVMSARLGSSRL